MICPRCSETISSARRFCPICGVEIRDIDREASATTPLDTEEYTGVNREQVVKTATIVGGIFGVVIVLLFLTINIFSGSDRHAEKNTPKNPEEYQVNLSIPVEKYAKGFKSYEGIKCLTYTLNPPPALALDTVDVITALDDCEDKEYKHKLLGNPDGTSTVLYLEFKTKDGSRIKLHGVSYKPPNVNQITIKAGFYDWLPENKEASTVLNNVLPQSIYDDYMGAKQVWDNAEVYVSCPTNYEADKITPGMIEKCKSHGQGKLGVWQKTKLWLGNKYAYSYESRGSYESLGSEFTIWSGDAGKHYYEVLDHNLELAKTLTQTSHRILPANQDSLTSLNHEIAIPGYVPNDCQFPSVMTKILPEGGPGGGLPEYSIFYDCGKSSFSINASGGGFGGPAPDEKKILKNTSFGDIELGLYKPGNHGSFKEPYYMTEWFGNGALYYQFLSGGSFPGSEAEKIVKSLRVLTGSSNKEVIKFVGVPTLNIRQSSSISGGIVQKLSINTKVNVLGKPQKSGDYVWVKVKVDGGEFAGVTGWVSHGLLSDKKVVFSEKFYISGDSVNIRDEPNTGSNVVHSAGLNQEVHASPEKVKRGDVIWRLVEWSGDKYGWVSEEFLVPSSTLKISKKKEASNTKPKRKNTPIKVSVFDLKIDGNKYDFKQVELTEGIVLSNELDRRSLYVCQYEPNKGLGFNSNVCTEVFYRFMKNWRRWARLSKSDMPVIKAIGRARVFSNSLTNAYIEAEKIEIVIANTMKY